MSGAWWAVHLAEHPALRPGYDDPPRPSTRLKLLRELARRLEPIGAEVERRPLPDGDLDDAAEWLELLVADLLKPAPPTAGLAS